RAIDCPDDNPVGAFAWRKGFVVVAGILPAFEDRYDFLGIGQRFVEVAAQTFVILPLPDFTRLFDGQDHLDAIEQDRFAAQRVDEFWQWNAGRIEIGGVRPHANTRARFFAADRLQLLQRL